jgi:hypothetical protein
MQQKRRISPLAILLIALLAAAPVLAQQQVKQAFDGLLTLDTIFTYRAKSLGPIQWQQDGKAYLEL